MLVRCCISWSVGQIDWYFCEFLITESKKIKQRDRKHTKQWEGNLFRVDKKEVIGIMSKGGTEIHTRSIV